jgi:hypothetical protein
VISLTDEQIDTAWDCWFGERGFQASPKEARREFARAIEQATAARAESAEAARDRLTEALKKANEQAEHFEREWYLRGDECDRLRDALIACRPAVQFLRDRTLCDTPADDKLSALLDTIDAAALDRAADAAKGQG